MYVMMLVWEDASFLKWWWVS